VLSYRPQYDSRVEPNPATNGTHSRLDSLSTLASLYYDFLLHSRFKPYMGAGIGAAHNHTRIDLLTAPGARPAGPITESSNHFAWQIGAGVAYEVGPQVSIDLGYRYFDGGSVGLGQTLHAQETQLGIRLSLE
jgi:opacity protein-like surface antigen